jgi:hypothetical protein
MSAAGFHGHGVETGQVNAVKARLGIPDELASCHTAEISGYAIEGHVPASAIMRLLAEKPTARGLAVPGMPVGAPGMDGWSLQSYEVILFDGAVQRRYARYRGAQEI